MEFLNILADNRDALRGQPSAKWLLEKLESLVPGSLVRLVYEPDLDLLQSRGRLWRGDRAVMRPGSNAGWCHLNTVELYESAPDRVRIATGWALARGLWVSHSWAIVNNRVVETTTIPRDLYFGFVMTGKEQRNFAATVGRREDVDD